MALPLAGLLPYLAAAGGGTLLGALGSQGGLGQSLGGTPAETLKFQRFTPQQQTAFSSILQQALQGLGSGAPSFEPIAQQARTQFSQQTVPGLAERFTQMGGSGTRLGSSGFGQALGSAGAGLEQGLASQQAQYGMDQQKMLMSMLGLGLTPQFETAYRPRQAGFLEAGAQSLLSSLPLLGLLGGR